MFEVGSTIVHPSHGTGTLTEVKEMVVLGKPTVYYVFDFPANDLNKVMIPTDKVNGAGIRKPVEESAMNEALDFLGTEQQFAPVPHSNFHRIHKEYMDKVSSGKVLEIVKVFKALSHKSSQRELGLKDKMLLERTEKLLVDEIEVSCQLSPEESRKKLLSALQS